MLMETNWQNPMLAEITEREKMVKELTDSNVYVNFPGLEGKHWVNIWILFFEAPIYIWRAGEINDSKPDFTTLSLPNFKISPFCQPLKSHPFISSPGFIARNFSRKRREKVFIIGELRLVLEKSTKAKWLPEPKSFIGGSDPIRKFFRIAEKRLQPSSEAFFSFFFLFIHSERFFRLLAFFLITVHKHFNSVKFK